MVFKTSLQKDPHQGSFPSLTSSISGLTDVDKVYNKHILCDNNVSLSTEGNGSNRTFTKDLEKIKSILKSILIN